MKQLKKNKKLIIAIIALILFLILTFTIFNNKIAIIDKYVENFIISIRSEKLTKVMTIITNISSAYTLIAITLLLLIVLKDKKKGLLVLLNLIYVFIANQIVKLLFRRNRPIDDLHLVNASGFSFPSGHSMVSMAFYGLLSYLIYINIKNKFLKTLVIIFTVIFILLIGFSRIYLGVHYFSDVIGGFLLAIVYLMIFIHFNKNKIIGDIK